MRYEDWFEELSWRAIFLGVAAALAIQVAATLLVLRPLGLALSWPALALVEVCVGMGAFVAGWRGRHAAVANGLAAALICAIVSLLATVIRAPVGVDILNLLFLFATFGAMGLLGGVLAGRIRTRRESR